MRVLSLPMVFAGLLVWPVISRAQDKPDLFKDVEMGHWAYAAVESLRVKHVIVGYPDGYFRGRRTLTRYEFAVALDRALKNIGPREGQPGAAGETGPMGAQGERGDAGPMGPPGLTPQEVSDFRRLVQEFKDDLGALGNTSKGIARKVDTLAHNVDQIRADLMSRPRFYGGAWFGVRSDRANGGYVDYNGRVLNSGSPGSLVNTPAVINWFGLGVDANIPGGAKLNAEITSNNFKNYEGGNLGQVGPLNLNPDADTYLHRLELSAPFTGLGRGGTLTLGRFPYMISPLILMKPAGDSYFSNPFETDGQFMIDGLKLSTNFGSVSVDAVGAQTRSVVGTNGGPWNSPLVGSLTPTLFNNGFIPLAQTIGQGHMTADELVAVNLGVGLHLFNNPAKVGFSAVGLQDTGGPFGGVGFNNVLVLGANTQLNFCDHFAANAEWSKSITGTNRFNTLNPYENNAFNLNAGVGVGPVQINAGYRYIDPLFYAPGYWGQIGNWINPTNIQGPTFRANYNVTPGLGVMVGGDFYSAARNRQAVGGLGTDDDIQRILVGLKWDVAKNFRTTVDWEGVYWSLNGTHSGIPALGAGSIHPTEHYITLGTGYNLTSSTLLKLNYQIGDFDGHGALNGGAGFRSNFNTFTGQVAVKF